MLILVLILTLSLMCVKCRRAQTEKGIFVMEMLEILKGRLPEGLEIVKVKNRSGSSQIEIKFSYKGTEAIGWLWKTCAPGKAEDICDFTVCAVMMNVGLMLNDLEMVKFWKDKQETL